MTRYPTYRLKPATDAGAIGKLLFGAALFGCAIGGSAAGLLGG